MAEVRMKTFEELYKNFMNTNTPCIVSFFFQNLSRMTNFISWKSRHNIHHLYLFPTTPEASWRLKNISTVNEVTEVV